MLFDSILGVQFFPTLFGIPAAGPFTWPKLEPREHIYISKERYFWWSVYWVLNHMGKGICLWPHYIRFIVLITIREERLFFRHSPNSFTYRAYRGSYFKYRGEASQILIRFGRGQRLDSQRSVKSTCWHTTHSLLFQLRGHSPSALTPMKFFIHILICVSNFKFVFMCVSCLISIFKKSKFIF